MQISLHAICQYAERAFGERSDTLTKERKDKIQATILKRVERAKEVELNKKEATIRLLNNGCKSARYLLDNDMMFVIGDDDVCLTFKNPAKRLKGVG